MVSCGVVRTGLAAPVTNRYTATSILYSIRYAPLGTRTTMPSSGTSNETGTEWWDLASGARVHARLWLPAEGSTPTGAMLLLHGVESHADWFDEVSPRLAAAGLAAVAYDRPGWGASPSPIPGGSPVAETAPDAEPGGGAKAETDARGHMASYAEAIEHLEEIATRLRARFGALHLAGLSWGGLLALYAALRRGLFFDSLALIAPGVLPSVDLPWTAKLRVAAGILAKRPRTLVPLPIHVEHFTDRPDRAAYIRDDPKRVTAVTAAFCFETLKMRAFCKEQTPLRRLPPTTLLLAGRDGIIDNDATRRLLEPVGAAVQVYDGAAHSLVFEDPARLAEDLLARIRTAADARSAATFPAPLAPALQPHRVQPIPVGSEEGVEAVGSDGTRRVVVLGAGAVGSFVGGLIALGGHETTLIGRAAHVEAIQREGLRIGIGAGERVVREPLRAVTHAREIADPPDLLILAVKSFDTETALGEARHLVGPRTVILGLQNGVGNEARIHALFPGTALLGGAICAYLDFEAPGRIRWADDKGGLAAGVEACDFLRAQSVWEAVVPATGLETRFHDCAASVKWSKLMLNVAFNALNALTGLSTAAIMAHREHGRLAVRALREGFAVMRARHIDPVDLPGYAVTKLARLTRLPEIVARPVLARVTATQTRTVSSMAQDLAKGRRATEIDEINGAVVHAGAEAGVPTPANERLVAMMHAKR